MDWIKIWFCESNRNYLKNVQEHEIFRNSFFSKKMVGLGFVFLGNDYKMVLKGV